MKKNNKVDKYLDGIIKFNGEKKVQNEDDTVDPGQLKDAFDFANSCRDKEIDRFWSRGTYFWGFIAASFAAYMIVFSTGLEENKISLQHIMGMSFISKTALAVLAFICFVFCLSWMLVHKGSKFWQVNWEKHIAYLGPKHIGHIYTTYLNHDENGCEKNPFSSQSYDYSVSKISYLCSFLLTVCSFLLVVFNIAIMFEPLMSLIVSNKIIKFVILIVLVLCEVIFMLHYAKVCIGNYNTKKRKWSKNKGKTVFNKDDLPDVTSI